MPRDAAAYLVDILDACAAIAAAIDGLDADAYAENRLVRSAVERECILIGEAVAALGRHAPDLFDSISNARRIVDFRNLLTHEYATVDDQIVWAVAAKDVPELERTCSRLLADRAGGGNI